ncbi:MAG: SUMF1/EgtB/PvdO family nonheme iron enzyme, partial [Planctomycetota bacterium]|nr:SUMF1/EgtB/PvdO family nonheme iron enzyme [Planctomycetota bacterium]
WSSQLTLESTPVGYYDGSQIPAGVDMANGYGLYDMSGNVWEWCWDWYDSSYYSNSPTDSPTGPATGSDRIFRGGCWYDLSSRLRSAVRYGTAPATRYGSIGLRVIAVSP